MVGGMGHASSVALGFSIINKNQVICLDGDGALLMHQVLWQILDLTEIKILNT